MKSLIAIYVVAVSVIFVGSVWMNNSINAQIVVPIPITPYTASTSLTIDDTGFNSPTDALQTASGVYIYQGSDVVVQ